MIVDIIGVQMDLGAVRKGVDMGPLAIRHSGLIQELLNMGLEVEDKGDIVHKPSYNEGNPRMRYEKEINETNAQLYDEVCKSIINGHFPIVLGGDHCIAAGSIPGALEKYKKIGVIWIDAHGDFNDEKITPSGNLHGMPLSAVCGKGPDSMVSFSQLRVDPQNVVIIGARALDAQEEIKLMECGVTVIPISEVHRVGIRECVSRAIQIASDGTNGVHLSFDMDALDPFDAPGVGTPVYNGVTQREGFMACEMISQEVNLVSMDFVETNPLLDIRNKTGTLARDLILTCIKNSKNVRPNNKQEGDNLIIN